MSLAQRLDQLAAAAEQSALKREPARPVDADKVSPIRLAASESRVRTVLPLPGDRGPGEPADSRKAPETRSHNVAINLIDEVSNLIPMLVEENETLRSVIKRERDRLEADVERATLVACEWRKSAESAKLQVENLERKLAEATARLERAETQIVSEKDRASRSARDAAEAECLSSLFEEKLLTSFGAGSLFQATLDRIRQRSDDDAGGV